MPGTTIAGKVLERNNGGGPFLHDLVWAATAAAACCAALERKIMKIKE